MKNSSDIHGIIFDLDGTLYFQRRIRLEIFVRLLMSALCNFKEFPSINTFRILYEFRQNREKLRLFPQGCHIENLQYSLVAQKLGLSIDYVKEVVQLWIYEKPLNILKSISTVQTKNALQRMKDRGFKLGVYSDYPAVQKLAALGFGEQLFDVVVDSTMLEIDAFKPNPHGFIYVAKKLDMLPSEILYVGDRVSVDIEGAIRAGMRGALVTWSNKKTRNECYRYHITKDVISLEKEIITQ